MKNRNVHQRVESIYNDLTRSERKIADLVLARPEDVIKMTASELAEESDTSPASVIRFCKSIGIPSFPELKLALSAERKSEIPNHYSDILPTEKLSDVKAKLLGNAYQSMEETIQLIDDNVIVDAINLIEKAPFVYVFGVGSSFLVAENIAQKWNRIGKVCICLSDVHLLISSLASAAPGTVFIGISNSGETKEVLALNEVAKSSGIKTIGMTQFGMNTLSKQADVVIQTIKSKEGELRSAATSSLMSQFITIDLLFYAYVLGNYDEHISSIHDSRQLVDEYKLRYDKK
ncbi:MurR/RpiR family transcriptional regulator [Vagococcus jeotgali]|uniref:MurR/RpiR family transcriptional regulator n=1 Tax=Vagococcus jeotgali TaxID=3109030 RepID=UPI002DDC3BD2|nr:MurR/RpiR family transcriptional regulator [Vagococcus sp. B2T-5]